MDQILNVLVFGLLLGGIYGLVSIGLNLISAWSASLISRKANW